MQELPMSILTVTNVDVMRIVMKVLKLIRKLILYSIKPVFYLVDHAWHYLLLQKYTRNNDTQKQKT